MGSRKVYRFFEEDGYKATVSKLKDNLIGWGCVNMLDKHDITKLIFGRKH